MVSEIKNCKDNLHFVQGMVMALEMKQQSSEHPFCILDVQPPKGGLSRIQAWGDAYDYIIKHNIKAASKDGLNGSVVMIWAFPHTYKITTKNGDVHQYNTLKVKQINDATERAKYTGKILSIGLDGYTPKGLTGFKFQPYVVSSGVVMNPIHCMTDLDPSRLVVDKECIVCGIPDTVNKKVTKILVDTIIDL